MLGIESIMDRVASELQMPPEQVRTLNMYVEGEKAVCGQAVEAGQVTLNCITIEFISMTWQYSLEH